RGHAARDAGAARIVVGGIWPAAAVQHHDRRMRRRAGRREQIGDDLGRTVRGGEIHGLGRRARWHGGEREEESEEENAEGHAVNVAHVLKRSLAPRARCTLSPCGRGWFRAKRETG